MARLADPTHLPVTVTAVLQQGVALDTGFGTALDGLLASVVRDRAKAAATHATGTLITGSLLDGGLHADQPATVDLPLARCPLPPPDQWHWLCTTALPLDVHGQPTTGDPDVHHHHSRIREHLVGTVATRIPASIPPASGRYRMRRLPVVTTVAHALQWRAVGNPEALADLLTSIPAIGRRRGTGEGTITRWDITPHPDLDPLTVGHLHSTGLLGRPTPHTCAHTLAVTTDRTGTAGLRPPYWHPATQHDVVLPEPIQTEPLQTDPLQGT